MQICWVQKQQLGTSWRAYSSTFSTNGTTKMAHMEVYCWRSADCNLPTYVLFLCHTNFHSLGLLQHLSWIPQEHQGHRDLSFLWLLALQLAYSLLHRSYNLCYWHLDTLICKLKGSHIEDLLVTHSLFHRYFCSSSKLVCLEALWSEHSQTSTHTFTHLHSFH